MIYLNLLFMVIITTVIINKLSNACYKIGIDNLQYVIPRYTEWKGAYICTHRWDANNNRTNDGHIQLDIFGRLHISRRPDGRNSLHRYRRELQVYMLEDIDSFTKLNHAKLNRRGKIVFGKRT